MEKVTLTRALMSEKKLEILRTLMKYPRREWSIHELSKEVKASYETTRKFVGILGKLGIVRMRKKGKMKLLKLNRNSPYLMHLKNLFKIETKPLIELAKKFAERIKELSGVKCILLFGSVARGTASIDSDVDILVLTTKEVGEKVSKIASKLSAEAGKTIVPLVLKYDEFKKDYKEGESFAKSVFEDHRLLGGEPPWGKR